MSAQFGTVIDVSTVNVGETLTADVAAGTTVLPVFDVAIFSELGGQVLIDGVRYDYTGITTDTDEWGEDYGDDYDVAGEDSNTITLLAGLDADALANDRVELYPPAPSKLALIDFGIDEGEAVQVTVPHDLAQVLADGLRDEPDREVALVEERAPGELYLKDVVTQGLTLLRPGEDLDSFVSAGVFIQLFSGDAASGTNYPVPYAGVLEVLSTQPANLVVHRYTAYRNVVDPQAPSVWIRAYGNKVWSTWRPEHDDTGWITTVASVAVAQTGWAVDSANLRRINKEVHFRVFVSRAGTSITVPTGGDIVNQPLFQFVAAYRPGGPVAQGVVTGSAGMTVSAVVQSDGIVNLTAVGDGNNINTGDQFAVAGIYLMP